MLFSCTSLCMWAGMLTRAVVSRDTLFMKMSWHGNNFHITHCDDVIMGAMVSQITSLTIVYPIVYSGVDQRKHQSSVSLAFCDGNSPGTGEFPAQMASNAENVSIWWRHHVAICNGDRDIKGLWCGIHQTTVISPAKEQWHIREFPSIISNITTDNHIYFTVRLLIMNIRT